MTCFIHFHFCIIIGHTKSIKNGCFLQWLGLELYMTLLKLLRKSFKFSTFVCVRVSSCPVRFILKCFMFFLCNFYSLQEPIKQCSTKSLSVSFKENIVLSSNCMSIWQSKRMYVFLYTWNCMYLIGAQRATPPPYPKRCRKGPDL